MNPAEIQRYLLFDGGQQFKANDFNDLLEPGVYVLLKKEQPIYVGMGNRLLSSVARKNSHMKRRWSFERYDRVLLYPCKSLEAAKELEKLLIQHLKPINNTNLKLKREANVLGVERPGRYSPCGTAQSL